MSAVGFSRIHFVMLSPIASRSRASVVENTFTPVKLIAPAIPSSGRTLPDAIQPGDRCGVRLPPQAGFSQRSDAPFQRALRRLEAEARRHCEDLLVGEGPLHALGALQD